MVSGYIRKQPPTHPHRHRHTHTQMHPSTEFCLLPTHCIPQIPFTICCTYLSCFWKIIIYCCTLHIWNNDLNLSKYHILTNLYYSCFCRQHQMLSCPVVLLHMFFSHFPSCSLASNILYLAIYLFIEENYIILNICKWQKYEKKKSGCCSLGQKSLQNHL